MTHPAQSWKGAHFSSNSLAFSEMEDRFSAAFSARLYLSSNSAAFSAAFAFANCAASRR
jgi:hypothetical protein